MKLYYAYASYLLGAATSASFSAAEESAALNLRRLGKGGAPWKDQQPYDEKGNDLDTGNPVPTYKLKSTNICAEQGDNFLAEAGNPDISCAEVAGGKGALGTNAPQTGGNVSCGANGLLPVISDDGVPLEPIKLPFSQFQDGLGPLCPANVHFHIGAEHSSDGEYDTSFDFKDFSNGPEYNTTNFPRDKEYSGKRCNFYKNRETNGLNFENKFQWKYCVDVKVGETYEVHWPHSSLAACGDAYNQYQTPFMDGLLCKGDKDPFGLGLDDFPSFINALVATPQLLPDNIGVQAQIVTVVDDERYYFPNFIRGMITNKGLGYGQHITAYLGSRTGGSFDDTIDGDNCDPVSPVSWQVDRKCQLISASTLDQLCRDIMINPGMRQCGIEKEGDGCFEFPKSGLFKVDDEEDKDNGKICCYPDTRPGKSRGVVVPELQADNVQDISGTCPEV